MSKLFRRVIRPLSFALCLVCCLSMAQSVLAFQEYDGPYIMRNFYQQPEDTIDVIHLGSSNVYANINPSVLWQEQGIVSYNLASSMQTMPLSYYYLKEALKTQTPKLVVLDVFRVLEEYEYPYIGYSVKGVSGMRFSENKVQAVKASFSEDLRMDYLLGFPAAHNRYTELKEDLFQHDLGTKTAESAHGYFLHTGCANVAKNDVSSVTECAPLPEKAEEYLNKIIALTKQENIPLLLMKTPYGISQQEQARYNTVAQIASAQNVPFINFNLVIDEIGLDFASDFTDYVHLNAVGSEKFSRYYAGYLAGHYALPNHQGEAQCAAYDDAQAAWQRSMYGVALSAATNAQSYLNLLQGQGYDVICVLSYFDGDCTLLQEHFARIAGVSPAQVKLIRNASLVAQGQTLAFSVGEQAEYHWVADTGDTTIFTLTKQAEQAAPVVQYQGTVYSVQYDTVSVFVLDQQSNALISAISFDETWQIKNRMV